MKDYSGRPKSQAISSREETYEVIPQMQNRKRSAQGICQVFLVIFFSNILEYFTTVFVYIFEGRMIAIFTRLHQTCICCKPLGNTEYSCQFSYRSLDDELCEGHTKKEFMLVYDKFVLTM